jgi:alanine-synthesizing transaminase
MLSRRVPHDFEPNAWSRALADHRRAGGEAIDLTESNPTRVGLAGAGEKELRSLADPAARRYEPDPRGSLAAREAIAGYYAARGATVTPESLVLTASTSEAYAHLFRLLADPDDRVAIPRPSYPLFEPLAALEGVGLASYRLAYDGRWHVDFDSLERSIGDRTRAIVLVQPNNPTGSCLDSEELDQVEALCERHGLALISDEVFGDFAWPPAPGPLPSLAGRERVPTLVLSGLSKVAGMPQMKLGWIALGGPTDARARLGEGLEWIADLFLSVATPVQAALPTLLEARHAFQAGVRERMVANLARLDLLVAHRPEINRLNASGGWSAVLRMPRRLTGEAWAIELLRRHGVRVHPGDFYDFETESHLVLSLIVEPAIFSAGLDRIEAMAAEVDANGG